VGNCPFCNFVNYILHVFRENIGDSLKADKIFKILFCSCIAHWRLKKYCLLDSVRIHRLSHQCSAKGASQVFFVVFGNVCIRIVISQRGIQFYEVSGGRCFNSGDSNYSRDCIKYDRGLFYRFQAHCWCCKGKINICWIK